MKNLLQRLSPFAMAVAIAAGPALAGDVVKLGSSGAYLAATSADEEQRGPKLRHDAFTGGTEIQFKGRTFLDNGIEVGFHTQISRPDLAGEQAQRLLAPGQSTDPAQAMFVYVKSGLGTIALGEQRGAYGATGGAYGDIAAHLTAVSRDTDSSVSLPIFRPLQLTGPNDPQAGLRKVSYFTPRFGGVQFGVSFNPQSSAPAQVTLNLPASLVQNGSSRSLEFNANYRTEFKGVQIELGGSYLNGRSSLASSTNDLVQWGASGALGLSLPRGGGDLALAGSYRNSNCNDLACFTGSGQSWLDTGVANAWNFGLRYSLGSWNLGGYFLSGHRADPLGAGQPTQNSTVFLQTSIDF